ncbi:MAG: ATP-binding protein [Acidobacteriota bacterium]
MLRIAHALNRPQVVTTIIGLAAVVVLGFADYLTGPDISFTLFYLIPLSLVAWSSGRRAGFLLSLISAIVWLRVDLALGTVYSNPLARYWNAAAKLGFFLVVVQLEVSLKALNRNLERLVKERTALLEDEVAERKRTEQALRESEERSRRLAEHTIDSQEKERRFLARELHDEIGQVLTAVKTNLQALQLSDIPRALAQRLDESIGVVERALGQISDLSVDLRPSLLDDFGLVPALEWYARRQAQRSGFQVTFLATPEEMRLPPSLETTCFRVAQAALTNVARHARAKQVRIELRRTEAELLLVVRDDGVGFDVARALERTAHNENFGLLAMQERVRLVAGEIEFESAPRCGTQVRAHFPLEVSTQSPAPRAPEKVLE